MMKKAALALACALSAAGGLRALDLNVEGGMTNLAFSPAQAAPASAPFGVAGYVFPVRAWFGEDLADGFRLDVGWEYDEVLRSTGFAMASYTAGFAEVGLGPFFGLFNSAGTMMRAGIAAKVKIEWPGALYLLFRSDSTIGSGLVNPGDYSQERSELAAGVYVPNAILSASLLSKRFTEMLSATQLATSSFIEYSVSAEIFRKNTPYQLIVKVAYQEASKVFTGTASGTDTLGTVVMGFDAKIQFGKYFGMTAGFEAGVYTFGIANLAGANAPPYDAFFFRASLGMRIRLTPDPSDATS